MKAVKLTLCLTAVLGMLMTFCMDAHANCNNEGHDMYVRQEILTGEHLENVHQHYDAGMNQTYSCRLVCQSITVVKSCRNCGYTTSDFTSRLIHRPY